MTEAEKNELYSEIFTIRSGLSFIYGKQKKRMKLGEENFEYNKEIENKQKELDIEKNEYSCKVNYHSNVVNYLKNDTNDVQKRKGEVFKYVFAFFANFLLIPLGILLIKVTKKPSMGGLLLLAAYLGVGLCFIMFIVFFFKIIGEIRGSRYNLNESLKRLNESKERVERTDENTSDSVKKIKKIEYELENLKENSPVEKNREIMDELYDESMNMLSYLEENHGKIIHKADWFYLDLIVHYIETGRADTLKDALLLADKQAQTDQICNAIESASIFIAESFHREIEALGNYLSVRFASIESKIDVMNKGIASINESNKQILGKLDLQKSLLDNLNASSDALMINAINLSKKYESLERRVVEFIEDEEDDDY